jgi:proteasome-associated ATPase
LDPLSAVLNFDRTAPTPEEKAGLLQPLRQDPATSRQIDLVLLDHLRCQHQGLLAARDNQTKLEGALEKLSAAPWFPAVFIAPVASAKGARALVRHGTTERIVGLGDGVDAQTLRVGDAVYLGRELNVIMARAPGELGRSGETCTFERSAGDGRLVVKARDEEFVVYAGPRLAEADLKPGDLLRWDRNAMLAGEKIQRSSGSQFFLEETPVERFEDVGGLGPQIARIKTALQLHLNHGETARKYRLRPTGPSCCADPQELVRH